MADPQIGSYLGVYYVLDGHHDEWNRWAVDQVNVLHGAGRMFDHRDHIHTGLYRFEWEHRRDADGVPAELTLDHRFAGMASVFLEPADGCHRCRGRRLAARAVPADGDARIAVGHRARASARSRCWPMHRATSPGASRSTSGPLALCFLDESPDGTWDDVFAPMGAALAAAGLGVGRLGLALHRHGSRAPTRTPTSSGRTSSPDRLHHRT